MTAAKGRKPAKKGEVGKGGSCKGSKDSGKASLGLLFKEVGARMKSLSGEPAGDAGDSFDYPGTIGLLDQILAIEPGNRNALNFKGILLMGMGEQQKALECYNAILKANPGDSEALNNKAIALYGLGRAKEAMTYVDRAIEIDKRYADALMNKAVMLYDMGQPDEARKYLARANTCDTLRP